MVKKQNHISNDEQISVKSFKDLSMRASLSAEIADYELRIYRLLDQKAKSDSDFAVLKANLEERTAKASDRK